MNNTLYTFKMSMPAARHYKMVQLSATQLSQTCDDLVLVPNIVSRLVQLRVWCWNIAYIHTYAFYSYLGCLQEFSIEAANKVQAHSKNFRCGKIHYGSSVPKSWISKCFVSLQRINDTAWISAASILAFIMLFISLNLARRLCISLLALHIPLLRPYINYVFLS